MCTLDAEKLNAICATDVSPGLTDPPVLSSQNSAATSPHEHLVPAFASYVLLLAFRESEMADIFLDALSLDNLITHTHMAHLSHSLCMMQYDMFARAFVNMIKENIQKADNLLCIKDSTSLV